MEALFLINDPQWHFEGNKIEVYTFRLVKLFFKANVAPITIRR